MASIMVIISSYLFGTLNTIFLSIAIITLGGLSNIFILKKLTFEKIFKKARPFAKKVKIKIKKKRNTIFYSIKIYSNAVYNSKCNSCTFKHFTY